MNITKYTLRLCKRNQYPKMAVFWVIMSNLENYEINSKEGEKSCHGLVSVDYFCISKFELRLFS